MKITVINISDSDKHFKQALEEYIKRLGKELKIIDLKPERNWSPQQIKLSETQKLLKNLEKNTDYKILLSIEWDLIDSIAFSKILDLKNSITFIIWGPYWLEENLLEGVVDKKISFWKMTLPHWLAKLFLLEQIFRWKSILDNKSYHY